MKYKVKTTHYDIKPGTTVYFSSESESDTKMYNEPYIVVTFKEGDTSEGCFRVMPLSKLEIVE